MTVTCVLLFTMFYFSLDLKHNMNLTIVIGFLLLIAVNIFFVSFVNDLIVKDVDTLKLKAESLAKGNLNEPFQTKRNDEVGGIYKALDEVSKNQKQILETVRGNAKEIDDSSKNVRLLTIENKDIVQELSKNMALVNNDTSFQIQGIQDIEFAVDEMAKGIKRINDTVNEVTRNATHAVVESKKGNTALEKVVFQMHEIQKNSDESMKTINVLGDRIKEIQKIVDEIRSISSRTNLLALNATIEAERAGENGDGFIVVAEEIKDLASKSTASTLKIEKISRNIMERKDKAIDQIEKSGKEIQEGIQVVNEASRAFQKISTATGDIGNQLNEVSSSSEQLNINTHQIVESIENAGVVAKEFSKNTSGVETFIEQQTNSVNKILISAEGLNKMTDDMQEFLEKYKS